MKVFFIVLDSCAHTYGAFKMLNSVISKRQANVVSVAPNVYKYRFNVDKKMIDLEVIVVESNNLNSNSNNYIHKVSKSLKRNISAFPTIIKKVGTGKNAKGVEMDPMLKRTEKNFLNFLR